MVWPIREERRSMTKEERDACVNEVRVPVGNIARPSAQLFSITNEVWEWLRNEVTHPWSYRRIEDDIAVVGFVDEQDATLFKLRWG